MQQQKIQGGYMKAEKIGFPLVVRPSYVLGGRVMQLVNKIKNLKNILMKLLKFQIANQFY